NTGGPGYQNNGYSTGIYNTQPQQTAYVQNTTNDYGQPISSGYPTAGVYGTQGQQPTNYGQYGQYNTSQTPTTYNQFPAQTQYGTYGQAIQYNQPPTGQSTPAPVVQPVGQPINQQVGYYQTPAVNQTKLGQGTDVKQDGQSVSVAPNYGYSQYGYTYGTTAATTTSQYSNTAGPQNLTTNTTHTPNAYGSTASVYGAVTTGTAIHSSAAASAPGTGDQTTTQQQTYSGYY
ncbi:31684_t:CDS:2, partial [Racocetra persica]